MVVYKACTANCGNDTIGVNTCEKVFQSNVGSDFFVINCQEVDYKKNLEQLQRAAGDNFTVQMVNSMDTYTKLNTALGGIGMASYIVCRKGVTVEVNDRIEARRDPVWVNDFNPKTAYNKGGLITNLVVKVDNNEPLRIQTVTGHLDSSKLDMRDKDWGVIVGEIDPDVDTWEEYLLATPHLRFTGYDANTRLKLVKGNAPKNQWLNPSFELDGLKQVSIQNQSYSGESTYKTHKSNISSKQDKARPGYTRGGMMDIVGISDGAESRDISTNDVHIIGQDSSSIMGMYWGTARDHSFTQSPRQEYSPPATGFDLIKGQLAARLSKAAPDLSKEIRALTDCAKNRDLLLNIRKKFLGKNGLLLQRLQEHQDELSKGRRDLPGEAAEPWFDGVNISNIHMFTNNLSSYDKYKNDTIANINNWLNSIESNALGSEDYQVKQFVASERKELAKLSKPTILQEITKIRQRVEQHADPFRHRSKIHAVFKEIQKDYSDAPQEIQEKILELKQEILKLKLTNRHNESSDVIAIELQMSEIKAALQIFEYKAKIKTNVNRSNDNKENIAVSENSNNQQVNPKKTTYNAKLGFYKPSTPTEKSIQTADEDDDELSKNSEHGSVKKNTY
jgi:hypothetical protein